jgi:23S rRNA (guanosine2251-2'-O)-methyltransferase
MSYILIIHDIRSVHNVGALFRTADSVGIDRIIISGYSPMPLDRFGRVRSDMAKSALGAELSVPWEYSENIIETLSQLKNDGYVVVGLEQDSRSVDYKTITKSENMVFLPGTETTGLPPGLLEMCDIIAEIPMHGIKESLNVSVSAGILLYRVLDQ